MRPIPKKILNIELGESIFQKEDFKKTISSVTFNSIDPSFENIHAAMLKKNLDLLKSEVENLSLEMKFVYAERITQDAQEFMQIFESENTDSELIKKKFIGLCIQGKNLKLKIAEYCEIKCDTDILDRIMDEYPDKYKKEKETSPDSNIGMEDAGPRPIIQMEKGGKGAEGCGCSACFIF